MQVKFIKNLSGSKFQITVQTIAFAQTDIDLMSDFGEPEIEMGGAILDSGPNLLMTMASNKKKLKTDLSQFFIEFDNLSGESIGNAEDIADAYQLTITNRITTALTLLRAQTDTFTEDVVVTI